MDSVYDSVDSNNTLQCSWNDKTTTELDPDSANHSPEASESSVSQPAFNILGSGSYVCTYNDCGIDFKRLLDLKRDHRDVHQRQQSFFCRFRDCKRAKRGFMKKTRGVIMKRGFIMA